MCFSGLDSDPQMFLTMGPLHHNRPPFPYSYLSLYKVEGARKRTFRFYLCRMQYSCWLEYSCPSRKGIFPISRFNLSDALKLLLPARRPECVISKLDNCSDRVRDFSVSHLKTLAEHKETVGEKAGQWSCSGFGVTRPNRGVSIAEVTMANSACLMPASTHRSRAACWARKTQPQQAGQCPNVAGTDRGERARVSQIVQSPKDEHTAPFPRELATEYLSLPCPVAVHQIHCHCQHRERIQLQPAKRRYSSLPQVQ